MKFITTFNPKLKKKIYIIAARSFFEKFRHFVKVKKKKNPQK